MPINTKGLGRGFEALFQSSLPEQPDAANTTDSPMLFVSPNILHPNPNQPREDFSQESLQELATSIRAQGILQPLIVRPDQPDGTYQIIAGERRWRAAQIAGLQDLPIIVRQMDDNEAMIIALVENLQRENLNPMEQAKGLQKLKEALGINQDELAEILGQSRSSIANSLRLLRLDTSAQDDLAKGLITPGHAKSLLGLPEGEAADTLRLHILETGMTVREAEEAAAFWIKNKYFPWQEETRENEAPHVSKPEKRQIDPDIQKLAKEIGTTLNCRTKISGNSEKGRISLAYDSNAQLYDLLDKLGLSLTS